MKTTTNEKTTISGVAYITVQADMSSRDGLVSVRLADLFFQCAVVTESRTLEEWDALVVLAMQGDMTIADALAYDGD